MIKFFAHQFEFFVTIKKENKFPAEIFGSFRGLKIVNFLHYLEKVGRERNCFAVSRLR